MEWQIIIFADHFIENGETNKGQDYSHFFEDVPLFFFFKIIYI